MGFNWTCPYCNTHTTVNKDRFSDSQHAMTIKNSEGYRLLRDEFIVCPNEECRKITLNVKLYNYIFNGVNWQICEMIKQWHLLPNSFAKTFPDYIPEILRKDYEEAMAILELSPKASATLSRRCIQGIIRDFWKISKNRLIDEIDAIKDKVDPTTWKSIDAIRVVGNIGAHMEKDINLIIDVDPDEAFLLTQIIEILFSDLYIHKHERELMFNAIVEVAVKKDDLKKGG